ncbi:hypothetical protein Pmar_PMAR024510 [Perkinsus marinus ATCC 50983]|uniref:Uncharacterized protein n=1 Tax=Perkinsus marinus (strain ATCC 50983 / TXsc) TaxID=423536 RepID=C5LT66_PERM5|nr:hypothetical protein Pmar_PMAR024510 [Perkinsus marinus ATCC 50983]EER00034.1 hypothetical protein Pmar_PMAR024510 [Perkinsus marinus ATCC 50983]|eukprot:XP_002767316.1 hypothetical protein Pmar_PMAR024510 [Perkinsus marinus ATCC 50983]
MEDEEGGGANRWPANTSDLTGLDKEEETAEAGKSTEKGSECSNWGLPSSFSRAGVQAGRSSPEYGAVGTADRSPCRAA